MYFGKEHYILLCKWICNPLIQQMNFNCHQYKYIYWRMSSIADSFTFRYRT